MSAKRRMLAIAILSGCGSRAMPSVGVAPALEARPAAPVDVAPEIERLGATWRVYREDHAPLVKLVAIAREHAAWKPVVPFIAESLAIDDTALDAAFDAMVALGAAEPAATVELGTPLQHENWNAAEVKIPYVRVAAAEARVGRALIPAYLAVAREPDDAGNRAVRGHAMSELASWHVKEARPLWIAALARPPFLERNSGGTLVDARGFYHLYALEGLEGLGFDDQAGALLLDYAFTDDDTKTDPFVRGDIFESLPHILRALTAAQRARLLACALDAKAEHVSACGTTFAMFAQTVAEVDELEQGPPENEPYFFGYAHLIESIHRVLACGGKRACLIALLETQNDRQYEGRVIDRAVIDLARAPASDVIPTLLATLDEEAALSDSSSADHVRETNEQLELLVPQPCRECDAHVAARASHAIVPHVRGAFTAPISYLHVGMSTGAWDPEIFAADAFAIGREAGDVGGPAHDLTARSVAALGTYKGNISTARGVHGRVMWNAEIPLFDHGENVTELVVEDGGAFKIRALVIADQVYDADAKATPPPAPAAIADNHGDAELETLARAVFTSRKRFTAALAVRADAIAFGSSIHDRWEGGAAARAAFTKLGGDFALRGGIHVERVAEDAGFAMANVGYLGRVYRVFAVFIRDGATWTIPMTHWSLPALAKR